MKTSFSLRVDKQRQVNEGFDADYFGTHQRNEKLIKFKAEISALEVQFLKSREAQGGITQLKELIKVPEIKQILAEISDKKKKVQKLEFAIRDTAEMAGKDE